MATKVNNQFDQILLAAKERRGDLSVDSMIVNSHLSQMRMFMLRRGVEFYCGQDSYGMRQNFIEQVCEDNMLEMKLDSIIDDAINGTSPKKKKKKKKGKKNSSSMPSLGNPQ